MHPLPNPKHEAFAQARVGGMGIDEAYVAAGYASNPGNAGRLNNNEQVRVRITWLAERVAEALVAKTAITKELVLAELGKLGFSNMLDYVSPRADGLVEIDLSALTRDQAAAIQEVTVDQLQEPDPNGAEGDKRTVNKVKFKLADKRAALVDIGKHLGMFAHRLELSGKDGGAIETKEIGHGRELARRIAFALMKAQLPP